METLTDKTTAAEAIEYWQSLPRCSECGGRMGHREVCSQVADDAPTAEGVQPSPTE